MNKPYRRYPPDPDWWPVIYVLAIAGALALLARYVL